MARPVVWGSELSPFALKLRALLAAAEVPYDWLPANGSRWRNYRVLARIERAKRTRTALRYPATSELDEYPLVPYLLDGATVYYDSSALARWLDERHAPAAGPLVPAEPLLGFLARLIDEAFDEVGLYVVHHRRWVTSAATNDAGARLARELRRVLPPLAGRRFARAFAERQVRRLPYLFSVAPAGYSAPVRPALVPPARAGFPPTHALLDHIWAEWVDALEQALAARPYLLGERFTLADASVYGQLGMNLEDPEAAAALAARAPRLDGWIRAIAADAHAGARGPLELHDALRSLLQSIGRTFVPLMVQNERAYLAAHAAGERLFNERAFDAGRALYDGTLLGQPFRAVVKTFQVQVWREVRAAFARLDAADRSRVSDLTGVAQHAFAEPADASAAGGCQEGG
ncbi:MAG TPA: glutathione S-transferase N-terminal domain-containing protein [Candidatus Limnocylindria bacterium]|nr:glutathione S-transferase N-terminal domain-containing protein [Candidatus Limnocylindria bacterium]